MEPDTAIAPHERDRPVVAGPPVATPDLRRGITWRAIALGGLLMPLNAYWITVVEVRWYTLDGTCLPLFITPIFMLFCLCGLNAGLRRMRPRFALDQSELLAAYLMLVVGSVLAGHDLVQNLFGIIAHADRFNTPERNYGGTFFRYLVAARFLLVKDPDAIKAFYQGGADWYRPQYLIPFLWPLLSWGLFLFVIIAMCLCLSIIIRRAWTDNERLAFPIVQLPLAMTAEAGRGHGFWSNPLMWAGFVFAAGINAINGMHYLYPSWPYLEFVKQYNIGQYMNGRPWDAIRDTNMAMYPFAIGLAYFLPLDLAFSCWFFFVGRKAFQVVGATQGWDSAANVGFPFFEQQSSGAFMALGAVILWSLRSQIATTWRTAFGSVQRVGAADLQERSRLRVAYAGLAIGAVYLAWFAWTIGMSAWVAVLFFGLFFLFAIVITRVRAEFGAPHEIFFVNPRTIVVTLFGVNAVGAQALTAMSVLYWYNRCYRCHPMPNHMEAFKIAEGGRLNMNRLIGLLLIATVFAIASAYWANLHVTFLEGAKGRARGYKDWVGFESYDRLNQWLQTPPRVNRTEIAYMLGGALMVVGLRVLRGAFIWWPLHPAGYALAVSFAMDYFWFAFFVSWLIKLLLVRFGGMRAHSRAVPLFLGLILGDYVMGSIWAIYGPVNGLQVYKVFI